MRRCPSGATSGSGIRTSSSGPSARPDTSSFCTTARTRPCPVDWTVTGRARYMGKGGSETAREIPRLPETGVRRPWEFSGTGRSGGPAAERRRPPARRRVPKSHLPRGSGANPVSELTGGTAGSPAAPPARRPALLSPDRCGSPGCAGRSRRHSGPRRTSAAEGRRRRFRRPGTAHRGGNSMAPGNRPCRADAPAARRARGHEIRPADAMSASHRDRRLRPGQGGPGWYRSCGWGSCCARPGQSIMPGRPAWRSQTGPCPVHNPWALLVQVIKGSLQAGMHSSRWFQRGLGFT